MRKPPPEGVPQSAETLVVSLGHAMLPPDDLAVAAWLQSSAQGRSCPDATTGRISRHVLGRDIEQPRGEVASDEESSILPGITLWHAVLIGLAQGVAIAPGLSRSGATIAVALLLGIPRVPAVRFSFLLSIPAILGGTLLKARHGFDALPTLPAVAGTTISFVSGLLFLWTLLWIVRAGRFHLFAYYTIPAGVAVIAYTLLG